MSVREFDPQYFHIRRPLSSYPMLETIVPLSHCQLSGVAQPNTPKRPQRGGEAQSAYKKACHFNHTILLPP